jgi:hypothetical protein
MGPTLIHIPGTVIHMPGIFIHIPGIGIHILPEFLFTSLRNPYPHAPEYAARAWAVIAFCDSRIRTLLI